MQFLKQWQEKHKKKLQFLALALWASFFLLILSFCSSDSSNRTSVAKPKDHSALAQVCAQNEVERNLKSPGTADFPWGMNTTPLGHEGRQFLVSSYVDSQNSFGALMRTEFICDVSIPNPESYSCETSCAFQ